MEPRAGYQASLSETTVTNPGRTHRRTRRTSTFWALVPALLLAALVIPLPFGDIGQPIRFVVASADSIEVIAGAQYHAGRVHRFLLGTHYRELWTAPIRVPVLRAEQYAGGLIPTREGGGAQTQSLHLESATGRQFVFRSTDKVVRLLPGFLRGSVVGRMVQGGVSAAHPGAALVAFPLHAAIRLPGNPPSLVVMGDSGLGSYHDRYAGRLGMFQEEIGDSTSRHSTEEMLAALDSNTRHRVDATGFLAARLLDFVLNDWDRHAGQWRWISQAGNLQTVWRPVPVDRDQAFAWYDGLVVDLLRIPMPKLVKFEADFPKLSGLTTNSRELDRRLLASVSREQWDSVTRFVQQHLPDSVLDAAIQRLPRRWRELSGTALAEKLHQRRERLSGIAGQFYTMVH